MGTFDNDSGVLTAYNEWASAYGDLDSIITDYDNGIAETGDVERAMGSLRDKSTTLVETIDNIDGYRENAEVVTNSVYRMMRISKKIVDTLLLEAPKSFESQVLNWTDAYSISLQYYGDTSRVEEIIERNGIIDPLAIEPGTVLILPVPGS